MLYDTFLVFLFSALASFIGSLQAGLVNTAVLATTVRSGREAGRRMAVGGALPEFIHAGLAFLFASWVERRLGSDGSMVTILASGFVIALGAYFLFLFDPRIPSADPAPRRTRGLTKGFLLGLANPQLLLFWCGIRLSMDVFGWDVVGPMGLIAFAGGATVGALILLLLVVRLGKRLAERIDPGRLRIMFRLVGGALVLIGIVGILRSGPADDGPPARPRTTVSLCMPNDRSRGQGYASRSLSRRNSSTGDIFS